MNKILIRHVQESDKDFWFSLDKHLPTAEFDKKVRDGQGYVIFSENRPVGILRFNLFWDNTPFCTLLYVDGKFQGKGYGKALMNFWERDMAALGYDWVLVSTQSDETAQHFYRKLGYKDCGSLLPPSQPTELFLGKSIKSNKI